ncbi:MAG: 2-methylcitrate dehydratase [Betaproteobacteria bacterium RIFCSPLOWO2_12_FULL_62_13]|nr:MAG: 2-methylcitrate dehydratase [Betaproteobacteria bacterium RIFCSPLOWO2_12_FULL_62_13]
MSLPISNKRPAPDRVLADIAKYASRQDVGSSAAYELARYCLMDALGCALQAFEAPDCVKLLGPVVPGIVVPHGARVPGTQFQLDPVTAAFNIGCLIRWLDFNDTWWAGGHPSDNIGGILATADFLSRTRIAAGRRPLFVREVMTAVIKAYEIQGVIAIENSFDRLGLDHVVLVKVASTAVVTHLLGGTVDEIASALSNAFVDGDSLMVYRKMPNAGPRKSWAAPDATSRAVQLALMTMRGEMGYRSALTARTWGFYDVLCRGRPLKIARPYGSHVIENIQFKIAYPAQRHTQTAAECAVRLHPLVQDRMDEIEKVILTTHELALKMVSARGPLPTSAARDHCLQYVVAVGLICGDITSASYEDEFAADPRIDTLRAKMAVREDKRYTRGYYGPKRCNANAVQVFFKDGSKTPKAEVEYLIGDARRRKEGLPLLERKFRANLARRFPARQQAALAEFFSDQQRLEAMPVNEFMDLLVI